MDFKKIANDVLQSVGGKGNVYSVTHCMTRLRFKLKDSSKPNKEQVETIDGVIQVVESGGQYQVVIGTSVGKVYKELESELSDSVTQGEVIAEEEDKKVFDRFTNMISGIFMPVLPILAASGMLKGVLAILITFEWLNQEAGTHLIFNAISDAFFYFFPILLGVSSAKYFKLDQYLGATIGAAMVYPTIITASGNAAATSFLGLNLNISNYSSTVFPVVVAVFVASLLSKFLEDKVTDAIIFLKPFIILVVVPPTALLGIGPVINWISQGLASGMVGLYEISPILTGLLIGGPWILMVMFGLHWAFIPIFIINITSQGHDPIMGLLLANQFAMAGAAFAVGVKTKDVKLKGLSYSTGGTTLLGISEPTLYGVLLPLKRPLIAAIIAGSLGAALAGAFSTAQFAFGGSGLLGIPLIIDPSTSGLDASFWAGIGSQAIGLIAGFLITYFWGFDKETEEKVEAKI